MSDPLMAIGRGSIHYFFSIRKALCSFSRGCTVQTSAQVFL